MRAAAMLAALLTALLAAATAQAIDFPPLTGRVVDAAGILRASTRADLTQQLEAHERATGQQIVVATLPSLGGLPIEEYGYQLGRRWGIGGKEHDTGVLLIVAAAERKVRIEVGYGLEGDLTDAKSSQIINSRIVPRFRNGDIDGGVRAGVSAIIETLGGAGQDEANQPQSQPSPKKALPVGIFWLIVLFIVMSGFGGGRRGGGGLARAILWGTVLNGMSRGRGGRSGGFGGGGFGGGGGGFSGGGGSFGGGGASGNW
jgi:uncharacterized protein